MSIRRTGIAVGGIVCLALLLRLAYGPTAAGYDPNWALVWGDSIASLRLPDFEAPLAPTPHPLSNAVAALVSPLGETARTALGALSYVALAGLAAGCYVVGWRLLNRPAGIAFAAIVLTRPLVVAQTLTVSVDIPFLALVVAAGAALARDRASPLAGLSLGLAGLLRPEAWPLAAVWAVVAWRDGLRAAPLAAAAGPPVAWAAFDLAATGDPLHSLRGTQALAEELERAQGLSAALGELPGFLERILDTSVLVGGVAGLALGLWAYRSRTWLPAGIVAFGIAAFLAIAAAGLSVVDRYLLLPATALAFFCALALAGWRTPAGRPEARAALAGAAVAIVATLAWTAPWQVRELRRAVSDGHDRATMQAELIELLDAKSALIEDCGPLTVVNYRLRPIAARTLGIEPGGIKAGRGSHPASGTLVVPTARTVDMGFLVDPARPARVIPFIPRGFDLLAGNDGWTLHGRCETT